MFGLDDGDAEGGDLGVGPVGDGAVSDLDRGDGLIVGGFGRELGWGGGRLGGQSCGDAVKKQGYEVSAHWSPGSIEDEDSRARVFSAAV